MANITLYPSNWLYNAGVIGFLKVLEDCGEEVENFLKDDGSVEIILNLSKINKDIIFEKWDELTMEKLKISYSGKRGGTQSYYYANQTENSIKKHIENLLSNTQGKSTRGRKGKIFTCSICFNQEITSLNKASFLSQAFSNVLLTSQKTFSNSYWNNSSSNFVCSKCTFILMNHHISLAELLNGSEVFINVPSFRVMWHLNDYVWTLSEGIKEGNIKRILGLSIVEMSRRIHIQLGRWEKMNIEVVIKYREKKGELSYEDKIDFFSLPSDVVDVLSDKEIASVLSQINEFKILELILDGKFREILDFGERVLKIALKQVGEKQDSKDSKNDFIENNVRLEKNRKNLVEFAQKLFKLYALIEQKLKREAIL